VLFYQRTYARIIRPGLSVIPSTSCRQDLPMVRAFHKLQSEIDAYIIQKARLKNLTRIHRLRRFKDLTLSRVMWAGRSRYFGDALEGRYDCVDRIICWDLQFSSSSSRVY
jgi:hypothetical protein